MKENYKSLEEYKGSLNEGLKIKTPNFSHTENLVFIVDLDEKWVWNPAEDNWETIEEIDCSQEGSIQKTGTTK